MLSCPPDILIIFPDTRFEDFSVGKPHLTLSMFLIILPLAIVLVSIGIGHLTLTLFLSLFELSDISLSICVSVFTMAIKLTVEDQVVFVAV